MIAVALVWILSSDGGATDAGGQVDKCKPLQTALEYFERRKNQPQWVASAERAIAFCRKDPERGGVVPSPYDSIDSEAGRLCRLSPDESAYNEHPRREAHRESAVARVKQCIAGKVAGQMWNISTVLVAKAGTRRDEIERADVDRKADELRADPHVRRVLVSVDLCRAQAARSEALAGIAAEKKLAKRAGVVDLSLLQEHKETVAAAERDMADARRALGAAGAKPIGCREAEADLARIIEHDRKLGEHLGGY